MLAGAPGLSSINLIKDDEEGQRVASISVTVGSEIDSLIKPKNNDTITEELGKRTIGNVSTTNYLIRPIGKAFREESAYFTIGQHPFIVSVTYEKEDSKELLDAQINQILSTFQFLD